MLYLFVTTLLLLNMQIISGCPTCVARVTKQTPAFFLPEFYQQTTAKKESAIPANKEKK
jgi:hypothetical protein